MSRVVDEIIGIARGKLPIDGIRLGTLFYYPEGSLLFKQFLELMTRLSRDNVDVSYDLQSGNVLIESSLCAGRVILEYRDGRISKFEIVPLSSEIDTWDDLVQCLRETGVTYGLAYRSQGNRCLFSGRNVMAVASLQKVLVAYAVYKCVEDGCFEWSDSVNIDGHQVNDLSLGISSAGEYAIRELLKRAIIASDNTATDALLRKVREFGVGRNLCAGVMSNKIVYENSAEVFNNFKNNRVQWTNGIDHFLSIRDISEKWMQIANMSWVPLDEIRSKGREKLIFKGGRAPGVFSGSWALRNGDRNLTFAMNSACPLTILDEIYVLHVCTSFLQRQEGK